MHKTEGSKGDKEFDGKFFVKVEDNEFKKIFVSLKYVFILFLTSITFLSPNKRKRLDTNTNGEERGFVVTGEMEKVFPFDILPMQLVKAAITDDIDGMENLGIYEVIPEDFALCEYVCTSKINIQDKIRTALDLIQDECM